MTFVTSKRLFISCLYSEVTLSMISLLGVRLRRRESWCLGAPGWTVIQGTPWWPQPLPLALPAITAATPSSASSHTVVACRARVTPEAITQKKKRDLFYSLSATGTGHWTLYKYSLKAYFSIEILPRA